ncbi:hypothetical protein SAMN05216428_10169 [Nitrosospira sp. Nsp11]|uniref:hypothetical protein n=1 Tax=Nitrosospira sp. Nsp11 TaxID=1855338 RepID=UPI00091DC6BB|nr:hypothetical protein [Nitrosospira sp. Nsp11]SHL09931.1 hypothetical protein SAMN05216428_10169 [Nitrosospira sp. Nsp11]
MTWQDKDWLDQPAHFAVGLIATYIIGQCLMPIEAVVIVMAGAFVRELMQHEWECTRVGWLDLSFFAIGTAEAVFFI